MIITESVTPPHESCEDLVVETTGTFSPPPEVIDCPDPYCGRLIHPLRVAAKTKDAKEILARAAVARYRSVHPELTSPEPNSSHIQAALSDLAVTGRSAYASFRALAPVEGDINALVKSKLAAVYPAHQVVEADLSVRSRRRWIAPTRSPGRSAGRSAIAARSAKLWAGSLSPQRTIRRTGR